MAEHRRPAIPFTDAPRGRCRWCGEGIHHESGPKRGSIDYRRRWHPSCVNVYNASDPRELRRLVRKRDRGVCRACGVDTVTLAREIKGRGRARKLRQLGFLPRRSLWELDHVVPLIDGGGHEAENLQTLCVPCHRKKSAAETRERAASRANRETGLEGGCIAGSGASPKRNEHRRPREDPGLDLDRLLLRADEANARAEELLGRIRGSPAERA